MKHLSKLFIFIISLTFLLPSCDPDFLITSDFCYLLAACVEPGNPSWGTETEKCSCDCGNDDGQSSPICGKYCHYKPGDCNGTIWFDVGSGACSCSCTNGATNPPYCNIPAGNYPVNSSNSFNNPNARLVIGTADYFPLRKGNYWMYDAYDSSGMEVVSNFAYSIADTFSLDTLDTILVHAFDYIFFDTLGIPNDTLIGTMLYDLPADSNQVYSYVNSSGPFIFHHFEYGDTLSMDGPDFTVADSIGSVSTPAGTFDHCIWLRNQDSTGQVMAPDVGMIQMFGENVKALELKEYNIPCLFSVQVDTFGVSSCSVNDGKVIIHTYGDTSSLSYSWHGPTNVGNIHNPDNLQVGYYAVTVSNGACSTMIDSIPVAGCANLPVELLDFTAEPFNQNVLLEWSTSTEINNDYFQLEHSTDGRIFRPIERIQGAGTSYNRKDYSYLHKSAVKGVNFYRLKQVDFGGLYEYSDVISVSIDQVQFSFYPNPASDKISLVSTFDIFEVQLVKMDGSVLLKKQMNSGENLNVSDLIPGMYILKITAEETQELHPIIISNPNYK